MTTTDDGAFEYDENNAKTCLCKVGEAYIARMNRDAAVDLLSGLHWLLRDQPYGEDISIHSNACTEYGCKGEVIGYCEFKFMPTHLHKKQGKNILKEPKMIRHTPHGIHNAEWDRVDFYVSIEEVKAACEAIIAMFDAEESWRPRETTIFETLTIRVMSE